jgi:hypothetical protein
MTPLSFQPGLANTRPRVMRRSADGAIYLVMVFARALATFSAGAECWQAQRPSAAAMNRTLAKFTDFMRCDSTSRLVMPPPEGDGSDGA